MSLSGHQNTKKAVQVSDEIVTFFDLLARFDYEDAKKHRATSQVVEMGSPMTSGEPISGSCELQPTTSEETSFKSREEKDALTQHEN